MYLFLYSAIGFLILIAITVAVLGKRSQKIRVSELWKVVFAIILFSMSSGFDKAESALKTPKIAMFVFASFLIVWFLYSFIVVRRRKNMIRSLTIGFIVSLVVSSLGLAGDNNQPDLILLDSREMGATNFTKPSNKPDSGNKQIQVQALLIRASESILKELGISANLKKMPDREELIDACIKRKDVELFSYPIINVLEGIKGGSKISQPVQYMKKLEDGNFALKTYEQKFGFETTATVNNKDDYITVEVDFTVNKLKGRLPIEGVQLDIGYPIIESSGVKTTIKVKDGEVVCLGGKMTKTVGQTTTGYSKTIILLTAHIL